ncbi:MAG: hypothetical protein AAF733_00350 [Verrucomicrobiota bacterium]
MRLRFASMCRGIAAIGLAVLISACSDTQNKESQGRVVSWPELVVFDELANRAGVLSRTKNLEGILRLRTALLEAGEAISPSSMPDHVRNPSQVQQLLGDLSSLLDGIAERDISDETLFALAEGLHPVAEAILEAAGVPHLHATNGPNKGRLHPVFGGDGMQIGRAEIKLHGDSGKVEVWLTSGGYEGPVWDLPTDSVLTMAFPDLGKRIRLAVHDSTENRDEGGNVTVREGATNYFVFPAGTEVDTSWLIGPEFAAKAVLDLEVGSTGLVTLRPHSQGKGGKS